MILDAVAYVDEDWWIAELVDYDLATQARSLSDLFDEVGRIVSAHIETSREHGVKPWPWEENVWARQVKKRMLFNNESERLAEGYIPISGEGVVVRLRVVRVGL